MNISKLSSSFQVYSDCSKLILDIFIDCLVDNDYKGLIISGAPTEKELSEVWEKVYVESCKLSQNGTYNEVFEVLKEIDDLRAKITIANNTVKHLEISFDQDLVNVLNSLALRCNLKEDDPREVLVNKLNAVIARMKKWFFRLAEREAKLAEIRSVNTDKIDRAYFDDWLEAMSENKGYHVKSSEITVSRFYRTMTKIKEESERAKIKNMQHGRRVNR